MNNARAFGEIMARVAYKMTARPLATIELETLQIRGGFVGENFTGYDYRDQTWRRARFDLDGIAHTKEGTGL
jgi:hypothetical protein